MSARDGVRMNNINLLARQLDGATLVEQSPDIIYTLDNEGHFVFINRRAETLLGYEQNELIGKHYSVIVHPEDIAHANYTFNERRIGDRASSNVEIRLKSKNLSKGFLHFDNRVIVTILSSQAVSYTHLTLPTSDLV